MTPHISPVYNSIVLRDLNSEQLRLQDRADLARRHRAGRTVLCKHCRGPRPGRVLHPGRGAGAVHCAGPRRLPQDVARPAEVARGRAAGGHYDPSRPDGGHYED